MVTFLFPQILQMVKTHQIYHKYLRKWIGNISLSFEISIILNLETTQVGPEMNIFGYNRKGIKMVGDMY